MGAMIPAAGTLLAACGGDTAAITTVAMSSEGSIQKRVPVEPSVAAPCARAINPGLATGVDAPPPPRRELRQ